MSYGLFRAAHSHNPAHYSDIAGHAPCFYPHIGRVNKSSHHLCASTTWLMTFDPDIIIYCDFIILNTDEVNEKAVEQIIYRNELKYQCSEQQMRMLEIRIKHLCSPDPHAGDGGNYVVRSVYFDDYCNSCYYENEDGVDHRKKYRIRLYDGNIGLIILECKEKNNGLGHKSVCRISEKQCREILNGNFVLSGNVEPVLHNFFLYYRAKLYRPKVVVEYERTPYVYRTGNVRITFDRNIAATAQVAGFLNPRICAMPVMPTGMHLLEVKYDGLLPDYIYNELQLKDLQRIAYSKYFVARRFTKEFCI